MTSPLPHSPADLARQWRLVCGMSGYCLETGVFKGIPVPVSAAGSPLHELSLGANTVIDNPTVFGEEYLNPVFEMILMVDAAIEHGYTALTPVQNTTMQAFGRAVDVYQHLLLDNAEPTKA